MPDNHLPLAALQPVHLGTAKDPMVGTPINGALHVFQVNRACEIMADDGK